MRLKQNELVWNGRWGEEKSGKKSDCRLLVYDTVGSGGNTSKLRYNVQTAH
jgi:hypothetical protein